METQYVGLLIKMIHDAIDAIANIDLKEYDLTISQGQVLQIIHEMSGKKISISVLEKRLCVKHTTVLGIVNRLEKKGYVISYNNADDKRIRNIEITKHGGEILEKFFSKRRELEKIFLCGLTTADIENLKHMLLIINSNLQELK